MKRFPFAPGVIDAGDSTFEQEIGRRHRSELLRLARAAAWWLCAGLLSGLAVGLLVGLLP